MIYIFASLLFVSLVWLAYVDIKTFRLPNLITFPLAAIGLIQSYFLEIRVLESFLGLAFGYIFFVLVEIIFKRIRKKDGLGRGDAKLLAAGGAWCGLAFIPQIILIASLTAIIGHLALMAKSASGDDKADPRMAFGPFLALSIMAVWTYRNFFSGAFV